MRIHAIFQAIGLRIQRPARPRTRDPIAILFVLGSGCLLNAQSPPALSKEYIRLGSRVIAIENSQDAAACVAAGTTVPSAVAPGQAFQAAIAMQNTGTTTWVADGSYTLKSQNTQGVSWGTPSALAAPVTNNQTVSFTVNATAPATPNTYAFTWRMTRQGVGDFGTTCGSNIQVVGVSPLTATIGGGGNVGNPGTFNIVAPGLSWTATSNSTWLTVATDSATQGTGSVSGSGTQLIYYTAASNPLSTQLIGTITVTFTGSSSPPPATFTLTEAANAIFSVSPTQLTLTTACSASGPLTVAGNASWTATINAPGSPANWLSYSQRLGSTDPNALTYSVGVNNTGAALHGTITFNASVSPPIAPATFTVDQPAAQPSDNCNPTLTLNRTSDTLAGALSAGTVVVTSNRTWTATVSSNAPWLSINPTSGTGNVQGGQSATYTAQLNLSSGVRQGTITFATSGSPSAQQVLTIYQTVPNVALAPAAVSVTANQQVQFRPFEDGGPVSPSSFTWSLIGGYHGSIDPSTGVYTAPSSVNSSWQDTIRAVLGNVSATATVSFVPTYLPPGLSAPNPINTSGTGSVFQWHIGSNDGSPISNTELTFGSGLSSFANSCIVLFQPAYNAAEIVRDGGFGLDAWQPALGAAAALENTQCRVDLQSSSYSQPGNDLNVNLSIAFKQAFAGTQNVYVEANTSVTAADNTYEGYYTVTSQDQAPVAGSVSPSSGSNLTQTFAATFSDPDGAGDIDIGELLINASPSAAVACNVQYRRLTNAFYLRTDDGSAWTGPYTAGTPFTVANSQCSLDGSGSYVSPNAAQRTLTVTVALTFKQPLAGANTIYLYAQDHAGAPSGYQARGNYTLSFPAQQPTVVSGTPTSGSGNAQAFTITYSDPLGNANLNSLQLLIGATTSGLNACYVQFTGNAFYLMNDSNNSWGNPLVPASSSALQNSQCAISGATVARAASTITINVPVTFQPTFTGLQNVYALAINQQGLMSQGGTWNAIGTWTTTGTDVNLAGSTVTSGTVLYQANNSITTSSGWTISGSAAVTFKAGTIVRLEPEFRATAGSAGITFRAFIGP